MSASLHKFLRWILLLSTTAALAACAVGPNYHRSPVETPPAFKEAAGWTPAQPADGVDRGDWWAVFNDPLLDKLERQVEVSNQNVAAALAAYNEAHFVIGQDRAAFFPTFTTSAIPTESKQGNGSLAASDIAGARRSNPAVTEYQVNVGATWEPDVWGKVRREVEGAKATAQAEAADLANAKLSAQATLATDYFEVRLMDAEKMVVQASVEAQTHSLAVSQNQYHAGTVSRATFLDSESTLASTKASLVNLDLQRTQSEHAVAMLIGKPPAELTIAPDPNWFPAVPQTPIELPSTLLQRNPAIAAAERSVKAANAQIGVQVAGYYPNITLSGSGGFAGTAIQTLFTSPNSFWSVGGNAAETLFNGGLTTALVREAKATRDETVAEYRQAVLAAFQSVEDELAASRVLQNEEPLDQQAWQRSDEAATVALNEYNAGTVDYTTVATAQVTALDARVTLVTLQVQRMTTEVSLIEALGGGWSASQLPKS